MEQKEEMGIGQSQSIGISQFIMETIEDIVYVADIATYDLYYLNGSAVRSLGFQSESEWKGKKCYRILQGLDAPCSFCTNKHLTNDQFYNWEYYNPLLNSYFYIQDKLVQMNGKAARLEIAKNITEVKTLEREIGQKYEQQKVLNQCVGTLHSMNTPDQSINELLKIIATYYGAERGYIFALTEDGKYVNNTYEWCLEGIEPQIENLQQVDAELVAHWFEKYETIGEFYINSIDEEIPLDSEEYEILNAQGITALVTAPLRKKDGKAEGFIGVDNPTKNIKETSVIRAVTAFISDFFDKNELIEKLNKLSYYDSLTGLKNRHSYSLALQALKTSEKTTLGIGYVDINGLKYINDKLGHQIGDRCIITVAHKVKAMFTGETYRIGGDEFVVLCKGINETSFLAKIAELKEQLTIEGELSASIGYVWQENSRDVIGQIERADASMYNAKQKYYGEKLVSLTQGENTIDLEIIKRDIAGEE